MPIRFENLPFYTDAGPEDIYALDDSGEIVQRAVKYNKNLEPETRWVKFIGGGFCQAPSDNYLEDIDSYDGDPRVAASSREMHKKWGGNPEERLTR